MGEAAIPADVYAYAQPGAALRAVARRNEPGAGLEARVCASSGRIAVHINGRAVEPETGELAAGELAALGAEAFDVTFTPLSAGVRVELPLPPRPRL